MLLELILNSVHMKNEHICDKHEPKMLMVIRIRNSM